MCYIRYDSRSIIVITQVHSHPITVDELERLVSNVAALHAEYAVSTISNMLNCNYK